MGKIVGLLGSASGKIGNMVFAVMNGIQTARVYQPNVSNPKSSLQTMQRAKGNLAGRVSSFTPRTAIFGLGGNNRIRRGEFLRTLLKAATVTVVDNVYRAKIDDNDVIFSRGAVELGVYQPSFAAAAGALTVTLSGYSTERIPADLYAPLQTRIVVMVYDSITQELVEVVTRMATKPRQEYTANTVVPIARQGGYIAVVYAIPMSTADGSAVSISSDLAVKSDDDIAAELSVNRNAVIFNYGRSVVIGQGTYTPA